MARINPAATRRPESRAAVAAVPRSGKHPGLAQRKTEEACPQAQRPVFRPLMGNQLRSRGSVCANPVATRRPEQPRRPCRGSAQQDINKEKTMQTKSLCASCGLPASENRIAGHDGSLCASCENRIATRALPQAPNEDHGAVSVSGVWQGKTGTKRNPFAKGKEAKGLWRQHQQHKQKENVKQTSFEVVSII